MILALLLACSTTSTPPVSDPTEHLSTPSVQEAPTTEPDTTTEPSPEAPTSGHNNALAFSLLENIPKEADKNIFFSPLSVSTVLTLAHSGAKGDTASQMASVLQLPETPHEPLSELLASLNNTPEPNSLALHNQIWSDKQLTINNEFTEKASENYLAEVSQVDFLQDPEGARSLINETISEQTGDRITELLAAGSVTSQTKIVLTNAVYFDGSWESPFDPESTRPLPFQKPDETSVEVEMMFQMGTYRGHFTEDGQLLELPYEGTELAMWIWLPATLTTDLSLTEDTLLEYQNQATERRTGVFLPKFSLDTEYDLTPVLSEMGMPNAFSTNADFSGIAEGNLHISDVVHKASVTVDEAGTEAAAATGTLIRTTSRPIPFRADRPFFFFIQDKNSGAILFLGQVSNPT